jgi:hypothetical protein
MIWAKSGCRSWRTAKKGMVVTARIRLIQQSTFSSKPGGISARLQKE